MPAPTEQAERARAGAQVLALTALEIAPRRRERLRLDDAALRELERDGLVRRDGDTVQLDDAGYDLLAFERRVRELARPDRHACACGAPIARFESTCIRCTVAGQLARAGHAPATP